MDLEAKIQMPVLKNFSCDPKIYTTLGFFLPYLYLCLSCASSQFMLCETSFPHPPLYFHDTPHPFYASLLVGYSAQTCSLLRFSFFSVIFVILYCVLAFFFSFWYKSEYSHYVN